ncbi:hypothetical protein GCM10010976_11040 [Bizionia arctica]|uniref:T9SS type A sorting domain-containing protein n=1 Tax=Bizionia arctica TaxID=1495645 RepID=A0A917LLT7_9FLAO|nr:hypothetical protein GCM10010976_11040 [Bizionia arctica]
MNYAQTITNVFPHRITTTSKVTIIGTDFTVATANAINIVGYTGNTFISTRTLVSATEMSFIITYADSANVPLDPLDSGLVLNIGGTNNATQGLYYIAPKSNSLETSSSFFVKEIYTNWDNNGAGFWRSTEYVYQQEHTYPNDSQELLGYRMSNNIIYSTGVNDSLLEARLYSLGVLSQTDIDNGNSSNSPNYRKKVFKAYSTNGVQGKTNGSNFILAGDLMDNNLTGSAENSTNNNLSSLTEINNLTIFDVIIDGINGLELSTGISNFNNSTDVRFYSGDGQPGAIGDDGAPDLLISQIADPGGTDIYYYADNDGNVVGWPVKLYISYSGSTQLSRWRLDLYSFPNNQDFSIANPTKRGLTSNVNQERSIRMAAFKLEDFGIDNSVPFKNVGSIENINMAAGGTADIAFMAYNKAAFDIKVPISNPLLPKYVCRTDGNSSVVFVTDAGVEDASGNIITPSPGDPLALTYEWFKYNVPISPAQNGPNLTISNVIPTDLATYKVKIHNSKGTIIMPVDLSQGGTPYLWNGSSWNSPYGSVNSEERGLVFTSDYNDDLLNLDENVDLVGCDCQVASGVDVVIPDGKNMKLYGSITVDPEVLEVTEVIDGETVVVVSHIPAGTFTLENNASLIQTKDVSLIGNENSGAINVKRIASDIQTYDYIYWSSPVVGNLISAIPGSTNNTYVWDPTASNSNGTTGDWLFYSGAMAPGKGYIKRVPSATPLITTTFSGKPNNGPISIDVFESDSPVPSTDDRNWNLVGNPYPSSINAEKLLTSNTNLVGAIYLWNQTTAPSAGNNPYYGSYPLNYGDQYITHNGSGSTPPIPAFNGNIASGQGFFVKVNGDSQVNFTNSMRINDSGNAYDNDEFFRMTESPTSVTEVQKELVWLNLTNEANTSSVALVGYVEGATNDRDRIYDAVFNGEGMSMYSVLDDSKMVIQGRSFPFEETDTVQLGIDIPENGIYRLGIDNVQGALFLDDNQAIFLEDTYTNVIHDLRDSPYSFAGVVGSTVDRFILRYTAERLNVGVHETNDTFVYIKDQQFYLKSTKNIKSIDLYDVTGKQLPAYKVSSNSNTFNAPFQYPRGVYIAVIKLDDNVVMTKKLIN